MTHDEQIMVTRAVLAGVRFWQNEDKMWLADAPWYVNMGGRPSKWTLPRCAEFMLWKLGERTDEEHAEYNAITDIGEGQDVDPEFMDTVLAGSQRSTEELTNATDCNSGPTNEPCPQPAE